MKTVTMVLLTILVAVLVAPVVLLLGIAMGPALLVLLFIGGIALTVIAVGWLVETATWHHSRHTRVTSRDR